jgi:glycerol-3-phosphate acyltransferase PlsY
MTLSNILIIACSYCIGAIPFGLLFCMGSNIDIRTQGSKNIGATNVTRLMGKKLGTLTLLADISKGFFPMLAAQSLVQDGPQKNLIIALSGAAAVIGHMYPIYLQFKGGKGVATGLGVFLFLAPPAVLLSLILFILTVRLSGLVSLGSLLASAAITPCLWLLEEPGWKLWLACFVTFFIWLKHYQNIQRLLQGTEKSWKKKKELQNES